MTNLNEKQLCEHIAKYAAHCVVEKEWEERPSSICESAFPDCKPDHHITYAVGGDENKITKVMGIVVTSDAYAEQKSQVMDNVRCCARYLKAKCTNFGHLIISTPQCIGPDVAAWITVKLRTRNFDLMRSDKYQSAYIIEFAYPQEQ